MEGWENEKVKIPTSEIQEGFLEEVAFAIVLKNEQELSRYRRGRGAGKGIPGRENLTTKAIESLENSDKAKVSEAAIV